MTPVFPHSLASSRIRRFSVFFGLQSIFLPFDDFYCSVLLVGDYYSSHPSTNAAPSFHISSFLLPLRSLSHLLPSSTSCSWLFQWRRRCAINVYHAQRSSGKRQSHSTANFPQLLPLSLSIIPPHPSLFSFLPWHPSSSIYPPAPRWPRSLLLYNSSETRLKMFGTVQESDPASSVILIVELQNILAIGWLCCTVY